MPCPPPGDLPTQGWNLCLLHWQVASLPSEPPGQPRASVGGVIRTHSFAIRRPVRPPCVSSLDYLPHEVELVWPFPGKHAFPLSQWCGLSGRGLLTREPTVGSQVHLLVTLVSMYSQEIWAEIAWILCRPAVYWWTHPLCFLFLLPSVGSRGHRCP